MPPPFLPAGGPPASSVGGTELFTPAPGNYGNLLHIRREIYMHKLTKFKRFLSLL